MTSFYAVVGWLVGGYLLAALLGIASGARVTTRPMRSISFRFLTAVPYSIAAGIGGVLILDNLLARRPATSPRRRASGRCWCSPPAR